MADDGGRSGPHSDLTGVILKTLNEMEPPDPDQYPGAAATWITQPVTADRMEVLVQRTWHDVVSHSPHFNGSSFSVCIVEVADEPLPQACFMLMLRRAGSDEWGPMSFSVGQRKTASDGWPRPPGGTNLGWDLYLCTGGLQPFPAAHTLEVELFDGSIIRDSYTDGSAMVFAPYAVSPVGGDHVAIRIRDAEGAILAEDSVPLLLGVPPGARPPTG